MDSKFFAGITTNISCEFICYSIHNMVSLGVLYYVVHQMDYYLQTFDSALFFSLLTPLILASNIYLFYLLKNEKIKKTTLIISLFISACVLIITGLYTKQEIINEDRYGSDVFFINYFAYLSVLVLLWVILWKLQELLIRIGSSTARLK